MSDEQYRAFVQLLDAYFGAWFDCYLMLGLRPSDRDALQEKFGGGSGDRS